MDRKVNIVEDLDGKKIVMIHDIRFKGKRKIDWEEVEVYLKEYVGSYYEISETAEKIYIGSKFPNEFAGSEDTGRLRGTLAKAKANMTQGLPQIIEVASNCRFQENMKEKHHGDAKNDGTDIHLILHCRYMMRKVDYKDIMFLELKCLCGILKMEKNIYMI